MSFISQVILYNQTNPIQSKIQIMIALPLSSAEFTKTFRKTEKSFPKKDE